MIELRNLTKVYREGDRDRVVFRDVSCRIDAGEVVVLMGPSGTGKSTLLNLISGIDLPTSGEVRVNGTSTTSLSERDRTLFRRNHVGFVFQFFNLIATLTVEENLLLPLELSRRVAAADLARARQLLEQVGLADRAGAYPDRLSGGEQQRVAIARALVHEPDVVLADEPTGNLDADTGRHVLAIMDRLVRGVGRTMVVVTHSPELLTLADRVFDLRDGRLEERLP